MATREENLKKINDELEKLNDEELDNIAGGIKVLKPIITRNDTPAPTVPNEMPQFTKYGSSQVF